MNREVCHLRRFKDRVFFSAEDCGVLKILELVDAVGLSGAGTMVGPALFVVGVGLV